MHLHFDYNPVKWWYEKEGSFKGILIPQYNTLVQHYKFIGICNETNQVQERILDFTKSSSVPFKIGDSINITIGSSYSTKNIKTSWGKIESEWPSPYSNIPSEHTNDIWTNSPGVVPLTYQSGYSSGVYDLDTYQKNKMDYFCNITSIDYPKDIISLIDTIIPFIRSIDEANADNGSYKEMVSNFLKSIRRDCQLSLIDI